MIYNFDFLNNYNAAILPKLSSGFLFSVEPLNKNNRLGSYLAGLIEGDGTIIVPVPKDR